MKIKHVNDTGPGSAQVIRELKMKHTDFKLNGLEVQARNNFVKYTTVLTFVSQ